MAAILLTRLAGASSQSPRRRARRRLGATSSNRFGSNVHLDEVVVAAMLLFAGAAAWAAPALVVPMAAAVAVAPFSQRRSRRRRDEQSLVADLPVVVELFRLAVGAGSSIHQAVPAVAARADGRFGAALDSIVDRVAIGEPLADALAGLGGLGPVVQPLAATLVAAERDGAAVGGRLDRLALDARLGHRRRAEEAARRLPVQLLFPLVGCVLPAFGLLTVVPLLAASMPHLS
jgi:tight adherence protein C